MPDAAQLKDAVLDELRGRLIPWAEEHGGSRIALAELPLNLPPGLQSVPHPLPLFAETRESSNYLVSHVWLDTQMKAFRMPYLGFVLDGEADLRVGIREADRVERNLPLKVNCEVISLPAGYLWVVPPCVPNDAALPHWWRPHPEQAYARIFWLMAIPSGAFCHFCLTRGKEHPPQPTVVLTDPKLYELTLMLIEELRDRPLRHDTATKGILMLILARVERAVATKAFAGVTQMLDPQRTEFRMESNVLKRACDFIQAHLCEALSPAVIARHTLISPTHLNRIFRADLECSVMQYVAQCRIASAKFLLDSTDMPIHLIGSEIGQRDRAHFTRLFTQATGQSPRAYRARRRGGGDLDLP